MPGQEPLRIHVTRLVAHRLCHALDATAPAPHGHVGIAEGVPGLARLRRVKKGHAQVVDCSCHVPLLPEDDSFLVVVVEAGVVVGDGLPGEGTARLVVEVRNGYVRRLDFNLGGGGGREVGAEVDLLGDRTLLKGLAGGQVTSWGTGDEETGEHQEPDARWSGEQGHGDLQEGPHQRG